MRKGIKKVLKVGAWLCLSFFVLFFAAAILIQNPRIQTKICRYLTSYYSVILKTKVVIGQVQFKLFNKLELRNVYIEDKNRDTLFFASKINLLVNTIHFRQHEMNWSDLKFYNTRLNLRYNKGWNYQFVLDYFSKSNEPKTLKGKANAFSLDQWKGTCKNFEFCNCSVRYDTLLFSGINGRLSDLKLNKQFVTGKLTQIAFDLNTGFELRKLSMDFRMEHNGFFFSQLQIETPFSQLEAEGSFTNLRWYKSANWMKDADFSVRFGPTKIGMQDMKRWIPFQVNNNQNLQLSGTATGRMSCWSLRKFSIAWGRNVLFQGNADVVGFGETKDPFLQLDVQKANLYLTDFNMVKWPSYLKNKYALSYKGYLKGHLHDLKSKGTISTIAGNIVEELQIQVNDSNEVKYAGNCAVSDFDLGLWLGDKRFGYCTFKQNLTGQGLDLQHIAANVNGVFDKLEVNNYNYANTSFDLGINKQMVDCHLTSESRALKMIASVKLNLQSDAISGEVIGGITGANLGELNLYPGHDKAILAAAFKLDLDGTSVNQFSGELKLNNTRLALEQQIFDCPQLLANFKQGEKDAQMLVKSDIIDLDLNGDFKFVNLGHTLPKMYAQLFPSQSEVAEHKNLISTGESIVASGEIKNWQALRNLHFQLSYDSRSEQGKVQVNAVKVDMNHLLLGRFDLTGELSNHQLNFSIDASDLKYKKTPILNQFYVSSHAGGDSLIFDIKGKSEKDPKIETNASVLVLSKSLGEWDIQLRNSLFKIADSVWVLDPANLIHVDSGGIQFSKFSISNKTEAVSIVGRFGSRSDSASVKIENLALSHLNPLLKPYGLQFAGLLNINSTYWGNMQQPHLNSEMSVKHFQLNSQDMGELKCGLKWDAHQQAIFVNGGCLQKEANPIDFYGLYYPGKDSSLDISIALNRVGIGVFKPYVAPFCKNFEGHLTGLVKATGTLAQPLLNGHLQVVANKITINYLGTTYSCAGDLLVTPNAVKGQDLVVHDQMYDQHLEANLLTEKDKKGSSNSASLSATLSHTNYTNFKIDLFAVPHHLMVLNTSEADNPIYYGLAFASGDYIKISGYFESDMYIDAKIWSDQAFIGNKYYKSKLVIPLANPSELGANSFITFVSHDSTHLKKGNYKVNLSGVQLNLNLDVTNDLETMLLFDQKVGDVIKAKGTGALRMEVNTLGNFKMFGNYTFDNGDYLFTLQNVINKRFEIEKGSLIKWNGDPYDAEINLNAIYKLRTTLSPLFPGDSSGTYKRRYPIDCKMVLSNKLMAPDISFEVDLPSVNDGTRTDVRNMVNNELEINRQVFSLMVLGGFLTPQSQAGYGATYNNIGGAAGLNASTELLSNQLSNLIGKLNSGMDVGVRYSPGSLGGDKITNQELQVALSTQFLNNRLTVDGNVGTIASNSVQNANTIVGDVNIEYKLTPDGKLKMKAFNKTNDNAIVYQTAPYTQGVGIFYREEFASLDELWKKYLNHARHSK